MASLKPLSQWICDCCGELIDSPDDGCLEWLADGYVTHYGFKIVHHQSKSPRKAYGSCYQYENTPGRLDWGLSHFVGPARLASLLSFLDPRQVRDVREWAELVRRLHIPYYEEARLCWAEAINDGFFCGADEMSPYFPENLKVVIDKYGK